MKRSRGAAVPRAAPFACAAAEGGLTYRRLPVCARFTSVVTGAIDEPASVRQRWGVFDSMPIVTYAIIAATVLVTLRAFKDVALTEKLIFDPYPILQFKEYHRLASSALLHLNGGHLFGNMFTLFFFGRAVESLLGVEKYLAIYLGSIIGGSLLSLYLHRHHEYRALGASGGVCGVLFAFILLLPDAGIIILPIPVPIPGWIYAIVYLVGSFFAMKHRWGNIGHDAHIGGAVIGLLIAAWMEPRAVARAPWLFLAILVLSGLMFLYLWKNPLMLPLKEFLSSRPVHSRPPKTSSSPSEDEINAVLEKVARSGMHSLTAKERQILQKAAKR